MTARPTGMTAGRRLRRRLGVLMLAPVLALGFAPGVAAATEGDTPLDPTEVTGDGAGAHSPGGATGFAWDSTFAGPGLDGTVADATVWDDGTGPALYVAGTFLTAGEQQVNRIARWDGQEWTALAGPDGTGVSGSVSTLAVHDGALIAGGSFIRAGGVEVNRIARWDGATWQPLAGPDGTGVSGGQGTGVFALASVGDDLIVGGAFTEAGGVTVNHVARWDGGQWSPLAGGASTGVGHTFVPPAVFALQEWNGDLIIGGRFNRAGGEPAEAIASWDGAEWSPLASGVGGTVVPSVSALAVLDDTLVAGGQFPQAGGETVNHIATWDGEDWAPLAGPSDVGATSHVSALEIFDGDLIAGGQFTGTGGLTTNGVARWDGDGWATLAGPSGVGVESEFTASVSALAGFGDDLILGGNFDRAGGLVVNNLARWDGQAFSPVAAPEPGAGLTGSWTNALTIYDGAVVAGGGFTQAGDVVAGRVARWDGNTWAPLGPGIDNFSVRTLLEFEGDLIAGGSFTMTGDVQVNRIARWDGAAWSPMAGPSGTGMSSDVIDLAVFDGELIAGGQFTHAGGEEISYIARWDGDGWAALGGPGDTLDGPVRSLGHYQGDLIAGGFFNEAGGQTVDGVARWDGSGWSPLAGPDGVGVGFTAEALIEHDGALFVGGGFSEAGGITADNIARWDGTEWAPVGGGVNQQVQALAEFDGDLVAGGRFGEAGGEVVNHLARWDGEQWSALDGPAGTGTDGRVEALLTIGADDGGDAVDTLIAGGAFTTTGGLANWQVGVYAAVDVTVSPDPLSFGEVTTGQTGGPLSLTVANAGSDSVTVSEVSGPDAPFAAAGGTCGTAPFTVGSEQSCTLDYTFTPETDGAAEATVTLVSDAPISPDTVLLSGVGVPPVPGIEVDPGQLSTDLVQGQVDTLDLTLANVGEADLDWQIAEGLQSRRALLRPSGEVTVPDTAPRPDSVQGFAGAPAAATPAGAGTADNSFEPPAHLALTHSESMEVVAGNSIVCTSPGNTTAENRFLRTFTLTDFGITDPLEIVDVTFGVESLNRATDIAVNLYTLDGEFTYDNLTPIGSHTETLPFQNLTLVTVPVTGSVPAGATLVVEIAAPDLSGVGAFFPGSNPAGESAPSYVSAPACGAPDPITFASLGAPDVHLVMAVAGRTPVDCDLPDWVAVAPGSGTVPAGGNQQVEVTLDATGLAVGEHAAQLCVASNDPTQPLVTVPVTLTVEPAEIDLAVAMSFTRGDFFAQLTWSSGGADQVDIRRDGEVVDTAAGDGQYTDALGKPRNGTTFDYQVCHAGTDICSEEVTVVAERRGGGPPGPPGQPEPSVEIVTDSLPPLHLLESYQVTLEAEHGAAPYTWSVTGLPAGLTLAPSTGVIANDPAHPAITEAPPESVIVTVTDSEGATDHVELPLEAVLVEQMAAGNTHVCAVTTDTTVYCWGNNISGQLGDGTLDNRPLPVPVVDPDDPDNPDAVLSGVVDISGGDAHTCVTRADGSAYCWGFNGGGRLGLGHEDSTEVPVPSRVVAPGGADGHLADVVSVSAGGFHTCALTGDGIAYCWGDNFRGQLGSPGQVGGNPTHVVDPADTSQPLTGLAAIGTGGFHTCAVTTGTTGYCWGWNHVGQLGIGGTFPIQSSVPLVVIDPEDPDQALTGLDHVDGGGVHVCAGTTTGVGYCWGQNAHGQVGDGGEPSNVHTPTPVADPADPDSPLTGLRSVGPGTIHGCAVTVDDTAFCWGNNSEGQLGDGTTGSTSLATAVADPASGEPWAGVESLAHNGWQTCAVTSSGLAYCWGHNAHGQLGDGTTDNRLVPNPVHPGT